MPVMLLPGPLVDALDLVLGRACITCDAPGRVLCGRCLSGLRGRARPVIGHLPIGLPTVTAAMPYADVGSRLILTYKEDGNRALASMLGVLLADAIAGHPALAGHRSCTLVPVPGHRRARRGFDALGDVCAAAASALTGGGRRAVIVRAVCSRRSTPALKALDRRERSAAIAGAFVARPGMRLAPDAPVIVVDDVVTSGATLHETVRALGAAGVTIDGAAVIADATSRH